MGFKIMNIDDKIVKLEKKLEKLQHKAYLNTKRSDFNQSIDRADWRKREPVRDELRTLKAAKRVLSLMDSCEEGDGKYSEFVKLVADDECINITKLELALNAYI